MPYKPKKPCAFQGCGELTRNRYCEKHTKENAKQYNRFRRDPSSGKRYGSDWRKISKQYLSSNPLCEICMEHDKLTPAVLVHHKIKLTDGGTNEKSNLQSLCQSCHSRLHAQQGDILNS